MNNITIFPKPLLNKIEEDGLKRLGFIKNAFFIQPIIGDPNLLVGRDEEKLELIELMNSSRFGCANVFLVGTKGIGKTTLLNYMRMGFKHDLKKPCIYVSKTFSSERTFLKSLLIAILQQEIQWGWMGTSINKKYSSEKKKIQEIATRIFSEKPAGVYPSYNIQKDLISIIEIILNKNDPPLVIMLDEASEWEKSSAKELLFNLHNLFFLDKVFWIIAGYPKLPYAIETMDPALRDRIPRVVDLKPFTDNEVKDMIKRRLIVSKGKKQSSFKPFTNDAIDMIIDYAEGIPRKVMDICNKSIQIAKERMVKQISKDIIKEATRILGITNSQRIYNNLNPKLKKIVDVILTKGGEISFKDLMSLTHNKKSTLSIQLKQLDEQGVIKKIRNGRNITIVLELEGEDLKWKN